MTTEQPHHRPAGLDRLLGHVTDRLAENHQQQPQWRLVADFHTNLDLATLDRIGELLADAATAADPTAYVYGGLPSPWPPTDGADRRGEAMTVHQLPPEPPRGTTLWDAHGRAWVRDRDSHFGWTTGEYPNADWRRTTWAGLLTEGPLYTMPPTTEENPEADRIDPVKVVRRLGGPFADAAFRTITVAALRWAADQLDAQGETQAAVWVELWARRTEQDQITPWVAEDPPAENEGTAVAIAIGSDGTAHLDDDTEIPAGQWTPADPEETS